MILLVVFTFLGGYQGEA